MPITVLLGPQRLQPTIAAVADRLGLTGRVALVTAGWQELESADAELRKHLGTGVVNLGLYRRAEEVFGDDPELAEAHRERQDRLRALQTLHRVRLRHTLDAARQLMGRQGKGEDLEAEREAALRQLSDLDTTHAERLETVHRAWDDQVGLATRPFLARHRAEVAELMAGVSVLAVAGGHVVVVLNRLRLFDVVGQWGDRPLIAWSAGAMALARRVFVYHDNPPQGPANAEVLETGLGRYRSVQPFPHAKRRLRLDDPVRTSVLARRVAPAEAVPLDEGEWVALDGDRVTVHQGGRRLTADGSVTPLEQLR